MRFVIAMLTTLMFVACDWEMFEATPQSEDEAEEEEECEPDVDGGTPCEGEADAGTLTCLEDEMECGGWCVSRGWDAWNCGECGVVCPSERCENGACVP